MKFEKLGIKFTGSEGEQICNEWYGDPKREKEVQDKMAIHGTLSSEINE